jgi:hypothetical protein
MANATELGPAPQEAPPASVAVAGDRWRSLRAWLTSAHGLLILACFLHLGLSLALVALRHLGWQQDEVVYLSQVASHTPALKFTPPRARGLPALLFPFVHFTTGVTAVRSYVSVLGALGLYLGLRPWLKLGYGRVVALAALMFTSLWVATFFGALVQPNYLTATAGAAALGYAMLALRGDRYRVSLVVAALWLALMALLRPSDATWFGVPLVAALLFVR